MKTSDIRERLTRLYNEKFVYLENVLANAVDEDASDAEAFDATIRLTGELNAIVESAEALFVDIGKIKIQMSWDLALIRRRVLVEKRERLAKRRELLEN